MRQRRTGAGGGAHLVRGKSLHTTPVREFAGFAPRPQLVETARWWYVVLKVFDSWEIATGYWGQPYVKGAFARQLGARLAMQGVVQAVCGRMTGVRFRF